MNRKFNSSYHILLMLALLPYATLSSAESLNQFFPQYGRAIGTLAQTNITLLGIDAMQPLLGNGEHFIFGDLMGSYGTNNSSYNVSPGLGYRNAVNNNVIVGGYLFGDFERTDLGSHFIVINPGVEFLGLHWDGHVNGYFPNERSEALSDPVYANTLGDSSGVQFQTGTHNQYDELVVPYAVIGTGVDAEVGYSFAKKDQLRSRVYLGGYYYHPPTNLDVSQIGGVTAGFSQAMNKIANIVIFNSYDQVNHYTIGIGINLVFGGHVNQLSNNIHDRLLDPVKRHIGIIATGAGTYDQRGEEYAGYGLEYDDVYFFAPNGTGNGTYGDPASLTQATLDSINAHSPNGARLYFQGGSSHTYNLDFSADPTNHLGFKVYNGQNFFGRSADYTSAASNNDMPIINAPEGYSALRLGFYSDSTNVIENLNITTTFDTTSSHAGYGIFSQDNSVNLNVSHVEISNYAGSGIFLSNNTGNLQVTNTSFINNGAAITDSTPGTITIADSMIVLNNAFNPGDPGFAANGINISNYGSDAINFSGNNLQILMNSDPHAANGINLLNSGNGTISSTFNHMTLSGAGILSDAFVVENNGGGGNTNVNIQNSVFDSDGDATYQQSALTLLSNGPGTINFSAINTTISNSPFMGLRVFNEGHTADSLINVNSLSGTSFVNDASGGIYGFANASTSTTINFTGATFTNTTPALIQDPATTGTIVWIPHGP